MLEALSIGKTAAVEPSTKTRESYVTRTFLEKEKSGLEAGKRSQEDQRCLVDPFQREGAKRKHVLCIYPLMGVMWYFRPY